MKKQWNHVFQSIDLNTIIYPQRIIPVSFFPDKIDPTDPSFCDRNDQIVNSWQTLFLGRVLYTAWKRLNGTSAWRKLEKSDEAIRPCKYSDLLAASTNKKLAEYRERALETADEELSQEGTFDERKASFTEEKKSKRPA